MKLISIIIWILVAVAACSTHQVKCHGPLRRINVPVVTVAPDTSTAPSNGKDPQP